MHVFRWRLFVSAMLFFSTAMAAPLTAAPFSTSAHPLSSSLLIDVFIGDLASNPGLPPIGSIGPGELTGTAEIDIDIDALGNGTVQFLGSQLQFENLIGTFDLGVLGTVDYALEGVTFSWSTVPIGVVAGDYASPFDDVVTLTFFAGTFLIDNATGPLADLVGTGTLSERDYAANPHTAFWGTTANQGFFGTVDTGAGGLVEAAAASVVIPGVSFPIINVPNLGPISLGLSGGIHIAVPEPSTFSMLAIAAIGLLTRRHTA